jgi:prepilin-type N-terminal cleavage/methylation domain-containing protein
MNKRGINLIELMIVIALLGVILPTLGASYRGIRQVIAKKEQQLKQNHELLRFYTRLKEVTRACGSILEANERIVRFENGVSLEALDNGYGLRLNSEEFRFGPKVRIWGFERYGDSSFIMDFMINDARFNVLWRFNCED